MCAVPRDRSGCKTSDRSAQGRRRGAGLRGKLRGYVWGRSEREREVRKVERERGRDISCKLVCLHERVFVM